MSKARLITLVGPLTILVGAMWLVASIGEIVLLTGLGGADTTFWEFFNLIPISLSLVPLLFALIGTRLRFEQSAGLAGRLGLALSVAGCAGVIFSLLASILLDQGGAWARPAVLGELHELYSRVLSAEPHDRVHAVRRRCVEIQAAAPLEPAAPAAGFHPRAQFHAGVVWKVHVPLHRCLSTARNHRRVLGAAWHCAAEPGIGPTSQQPRSEALLPPGAANSFSFRASVTIYLIAGYYR